MLLTSYLNSESSFVTVRGPRVKRLAILSATACSPKDERSGLPAEAALVPESFGGTPAGTLIAFGGHCRRGGLGAEVWDPNGHSGIVDVVDMAALGSGYNWPLGVFPGHGDELWAAFAGAPLIHYRDGRFESIPTPGGLLAATAQPGGPLYAATATAIHRLDDGAWAKLAEWPWPAAILTLAEENGVFWVSVGQRFKDSSVYRLAPAAPFALTDECRAPFVHLYDVSEKNGPTFTYPTTRKALASFDKASDLGLVEFIEAGVKRLGVTAKTKAAAEALVAHLATAMPKEHPRPLCYVPQSPRAIDLAGGK